MSGQVTARQSAKRQCGWLVAAAAGLWLLLAGPAFALAGVRGLEGLTYAALLCTLPGCLALALTASLRANAALVAMLLGMVLRLLFVLGGALVVRDQRPDLNWRSFFVWLVGFYLATLLVETWLAVQGSLRGLSAER